MKRAILSAILAVGLLVSMVVPAVAAEPVSKPMILFQPDLYEAELAYGFDFQPTVAAQDLPRVTPYWVDMVNGEYYPDGGEGIYVAVLDTGLVEDWEYYFGHANIAEEWGKGFSHDVYWCPDADDGQGGIVWGPVHGDRGFLSGYSSGHGTHVTSTIVGFNFLDLFVVEGVAPQATIIPVLCLDAWAVQRPDGTWYTATGGTWDMISEAIRYIGDLAEEEGIKIVINMSLGAGVPNTLVEEAIHYAIDRGVIIVASAGNAGYAGMGWPGAYPEVISVGAGGWTEQYLGRPPQPYWWLNDVPEKLNTEDYWGNNWQMYLAPFSSRPNKDLGQKSFHLDVTTPGRLVVGPYRPYFDAFGEDEGYYLVSGTSMAAPHVAGIAAVVLEVYPQLNQFQMEFILKNAAQGLPLACDGSLVVERVLVDPGPPPVFAWMTFWYDWYGTDYGAGWLTADRAMSRADVFVRSRFMP